MFFKDSGLIFKPYPTVYGNFSNDYFPESSMAASETLWLNISKSESKSRNIFPNAIYWLFEDSEYSWGNINQRILQKHKKSYKHKKNEVYKIRKYSPIGVPWK